MASGSFYDLNVPCVTANDLNTIIRNWKDNVYRTIALNQIVDLTEVVPQKKRKRGDKTDEIVVPEPYSLTLPTDCQGKITVLNRLTVKVSHESQFPKIFKAKASQIKKYDIIALMPMEKTCLQLACSSGDIDLICFDYQSKLNLKFTQKLYKMALEQNKFFEISYSGALKDSTIFKNTAFISHLLCSIGKSKNVIISSGTSDSFLLRTPYEVIALSFVFGLHENIARGAITCNPSNLINRATKRRQGKTCISVST